MIAVLVAGAVLWLIVAIIGLLIKGLFWLFVVGLIFFIVASVGAGISHRRSRVK